MRLSDYRRAPRSRHIPPCAKPAALARRDEHRAPRVFGTRIGTGQQREHQDVTGPLNKDRINRANAALAGQR